MFPNLYNEEKVRMSSHSRVNPHYRLLTGRGKTATDHVGAFMNKYYIVGKRPLVIKSRDPPSRVSFYRGICAPQTTLALLRRPGPKIPSDLLNFRGCKRAFCRGTGSGFRLLWTSVNRQSFVFAFLLFFGCIPTMPPQYCKC